MPPRSIDLRPGRPWVPSSSSSAWRRAWRGVGSEPLPAEYPEPAGELELRRALSTLLRRTRGLHAEPEHIVVTAGTGHGLALALRALENDSASPTIAIEDPGYRAAVETARDRRWKILDVPVDADGLDVETLSGTDESVTAVYTTPSHQYPIGGLLPIGRRRRLADYAAATDATVVEDDYDSEFRYDVAPLPTLAQLAPDRVIHLGTVAKTLGAGLRLGWMVGPPPIVDAVVRHRSAVGDHPSVPLQRAFASLVRDGEWDRAVRAARRRYRDRDRLVSDALSPFGELHGVGAGLHTTILLEPDVAESVARDARDAGVTVPTVSLYTRSSAVDGLVIGYGRVGDDELVRALQVIADSARRHTQSTHTQSTHTTRSTSPPSS